MSGIAFEDWVAGADFYAAPFPTSSFGDDVGSIENIRSPQLGVQWGSSGGWNADIRAVWGTPRPLQILSMLDIRRGTGGLGQVRYGYIDALSNIVWFDAAIRPIYTYPNSDFIRHDHLVLANPVSALGAVLSITNAGAPLTFGRLWAGPIWSPSSGVERRWSSGIVDPGTLQKSRGGQGYERREQRSREHEGSFAQMPFEEAFGNEAGSVVDLQQIAMKLGNTSPCILFPRLFKPNGTIDSHSVHRLGVYGHFKQPIRINHNAGNYFGANMSFAELF